jgi:hypothetical protein
MSLTPKMMMTNARENWEPFVAVVGEHGELDGN